MNLQKRGSSHDVKEIHDYGVLWKLMMETSLQLRPRALRYSTSAGGKALMVGVGTQWSGGQLKPIVISKSEQAAATTVSELLKA